MRTNFIFCVLLMPSALAWRIDRRCLEEGQLLVGDEVDGLLGTDEEDNDGVFLDDNNFDWDGLTLYEFEDEEEETSNLRGSSDSFFRNQTVGFSDVARNLQGGRTFNIKLTWKRGACWQDEWIERNWCMGCRRSCNSGDALELKSCSRSWKQRFQWQNGKIKVASKNMCLTRSGNGLRLRSCGGGNQQFRGFQGSGGFQLKPSGSSKCLSQHHHPKAGEVIELINCGLAAQHNTDKWNVYWSSGGGGGGGGGGDGGNNNKDDDDDDDDDGNNNGGGSGPALKQRGQTCSSGNKCGKCEGDCDSDSDCKGNMRCRQRFGRNALSPISGCSGTGKKGLDYCS